MISHKILLNLKYYLNTYLINDEFKSQSLNLLLDLNDLTILTIDVKIRTILLTSYVCTQSFLRLSHNLTVQSAEPDVRKSPEGKKSSDLIVEVWPRNVLITDN